jgi:mannose-1-phosphate guanylyltransferase/mannose-6-phosphate isomerase
MTPKITPVVLCGGSGERIWPLSRKSYPKQFLSLTCVNSLFQQAATRLADAASPLVVTGDEYRFIARQQLNEAGVVNADVIIEPEGKNTAPAILAAACHLAAESPNSVMLVMPADHFIPDASEFTRMVKKAVNHLSFRQIVCFGVTPERPETGYGYIRLGEKENVITPVAAFIEKPDLANVESFLADGGYLWNSGIFMMRPAELLELAAELQPDMLKAVQQAILLSSKDLDFIRLNPIEWARVEAQSFDYCFMENATEIGCLAFNGVWSDLGDWQALAREKEVDSSGNVLHGHAHQIDSLNSLLWAEKDGLVLTGIGLDNIMAIAMGDAVLVADRARAQDVKTMVTQLKAKGVSQALSCERENRPWGWFETIARGEAFHVKILHVDPGGRLSLQSHEHRSEHWVVVKGIATVVRGEEEFLLHANESTYIHIGDKHRLCNNTDDNLEIIEVQTGTYFGEDDIERYSDEYSRH